MNNQNTTTLASQLRRRLLHRFIFSYILYVGTGGLIFLLVYWYYHTVIWMGWEPFYLFVSTLERFREILLFLYLSVGALIFGTYYLSKSCAYLTELLNASDSLWRDSDTPVTMSDDLREAALHMNEVRMNIKNSQQAAAEAEQRKNDLVVYLAHDLKTPLTSVIGYLTLLYDEKEISPALQDKYLSIALEKAERLEDLINEFFDITRFNLTHLSLDLSRINLTRMLEQTVYEFAPMFSEKHLDYTLSAPPNLSFVCDPDKLQRVFDNLLRNAVNYSFSDTVIQISLTREENTLILTVQNEGPTIPPEKLERIFEQFFRLDSARTSRSGGSGLGLAIAREIVELHNGTITAESHDQLIIFRVVLPCS
ncbi:sensor histidine kinase [Sellimonas sp.]|uniref:sensor histidine kinase n=1 Tax=Sellimonas sp. TaxID=2021466 RepID=UPI002FE6CB0A